LAWCKPEPLVQSLEYLEMKKSLVALAALAATSAFAQSSVTISGVLDAGYRSVSGPLGTSTKGGFQNGTATSAIILSGTEDLGGGMSAIFRYEINPDFVAGSGLSGSVLQTTDKADLSAAGTSNTVRTSNGANGYNFVGIQTKDMGAIRIGRLNTSTLAAWGVGSVFALLWVLAMAPTVTCLQALLLQLPTSTRPLLPASTAQWSTPLPASTASLVVPCLCPRLTMLAAVAKTTAL